MASRFWIGGTGAWDSSTTTNWSSSSGGTGGASVPGSSDTVTFDGSSGGGTVTVNTNFTVTSITMGAFTGTLDFSANNNSPTMTTFSCSGTGTRTLNMGSGTWTISGNNTTIWDMTTITGLTLNANTSTINFTYSGSTGNRTLAGAVTLNNIAVTAGSDAFLPAASMTFNNIDFTGFTGALSTNAFSAIGNVKFGTGMTVQTTSNPLTMAATSGTKTITTNGVTINRALTIDGVGGTFVFADAYTSTARGITINNGALVNSNNVAVSITSLSCNNSNVRTLNMGAATWTISSTGGAWNTGNITNLTFVPATLIEFTDTTNSAITFTGGGLTFNNIYWHRGASTATNTIQSANTFLDFKDDGTAAHTIVFPNVTTTVSTFTVSGTSGHLITLSRTGSSGTFTLTDAGGVISSDYLSISNSTATNGSWFAGANSTDGGGNTGWIFTVPPSGTASPSNPSIPSIPSLA